MSSKGPSKVLKADNSRDQFVGGKETYIFGGYRLESDSRLLSREGERLGITPKAFDVLLLLARNPGRVIEKEEFFRILWPDAVVEESNLTQTVFVLRKILREKESGQSFISTVPGRGYLFVCPVTQIDEPAPLSPDLPPTRRRWAVPLSLCVFLTFPAWFWFSRHDSPVIPRLQSLTAYPGTESWPALSPDGTQVAFVWDDAARQNPGLYVLRIGTDHPVRLTHGSSAETSPSWSPDGMTIAFVRAGPGSASIYAVPAAGGQEQLIREIYPIVTDQYGRYLDWSPDGKSLAVTLKKTMEEAGRLVLIPAVGAGAEARPLTNPPTHIHCDSNPVYSPDGRYLAFMRTERYSVADIYVAPSNRDGTAQSAPQRVTFDNQLVGGLTWTGDSNEIVFSSNRGGRRGLWRIGIAGGNLQPVRMAGDDAMYPSIARQAKKLCYAKLSKSRNIWRIPVPRNGTASELPTKLIASTQEQGGPQYSPDGKKIAFGSNRSGSNEIWVSNADGSDPERLTASGGPLTGLPRWSPDGKLISFDSRTASGHLCISVIPSIGGPPKQLTDDSAEDTKSSWSHDGQWVYFSSNRTGRYQIWKISAQGGSSVQVTRQGGHAPFESADGKFVYYAKERQSPAIWRVPVGGGEERPVLENPHPKTWSFWALSPSGIFFLTQPDDSVFEGGKLSEIHFFDFQSRKTTRITELRGEMLISSPGLAVSPDGRYLLYPQVDEAAGDLILLEGFR